MNMRMVAAILALFVTAGERIELEFMILRMVVPEEIAYQENKYMIMFMVASMMLLFSVIPLGREDNL